MCSASWELAVDGPHAGTGSARWCCRCVSRSGRAAARSRSSAWPHEEQEHEHLALQHWHGDGAVLLLRADPRRMALLLERLSYVDLTDVWDIEACEIVAGFYPRLHKPAPPQLMRLSAYVGSYLRPARRAAPGRARAASPRRASGLARPGLRRRPRYGRPADPCRPALRERAGRRARAVAGHRPPTEVGRPALRGGPAPLEPLGRARRRRARRCSATVPTTRTGSTPRSRPT